MTPARLTASIAAALAVLVQGAVAAPAMAQGYPQTVDSQSYYRSQSSGYESQSYQTDQGPPAGGRYWTRETRTIVEQRPVVHHLVHTCGCHVVRSTARHVSYARTARTETIWVEHIVAPPPAMPAPPPPPSDETIPASFFADEGGVGPYPADFGGGGGGGGGGYVYGGGAAQASASASVDASISLSAGFHGRGGVGGHRGGWGGHGGGGMGGWGGGHSGGGCGCKK